MASMLFRCASRIFEVTILVLFTSLLAFAQGVSVEQLGQTLTTLKATQASDGATARAIGSMELNEHLTDLTLNRMKAEFEPGPKTLLSLEFLAYSSMFLDPPPGELIEREPPDDAAAESMLSAANNFVATTLRHMPDFLATRITRSFDNSSVAVSHPGTPPSQLQLMGTMSQEITYRDGRETTLENSSISKFKSSREESGPGLTSQGEFGPILATVLGDSSRGSVTWSHWEQTTGSLAAVFHYQVPANASHYVVDFCCENDDFPNFPGSFYHGTPAYHGSLFVDPTTGAILRITLEAELDSSGPLIRSAVSVEYGSVNIGEKSYICPVQSVAVSSARSYLVKDSRETTVHRLNQVVFTNYHRFGSTVRMLPVPQTP
jgi:hypothetical protein